MNAGVDTEARRQQAVLAILAGQADAGLVLREPAERAARGLAAYRANAQALAERALAAAFPTVQAMLGEADFAQLAREHWLAHPPLRGDIGEWGGELPAAIEAHAGLTAWPWLADCARLDLALHRCERAADARFDAGSLTLLGDADPGELRLEPMPGFAVLASRHPIVTIHAAHARAAGADTDAFTPVREALAAGRGEAACVLRSGWRAVVQPIDTATAGATLALLAAPDLGAGLEGAGPDFDFTAWLAGALSGGWLKGVVRWRD